MTQGSRFLITGILVLAGIAFFLFNNSGYRAGRSSYTAGEIPDSAANPGGQQGARLPMLVDLGKGTCIPCKKMKPILDELKLEYQGKATVRIIDLRDEPKEAGRYGIRLIPTQIFFDAAGKEVFRHEGFMDKQSIQAKFIEMGVK
ncbi:MAG: thioredoxin domain-containing protein [Candidatus Zixiibacteriota bacterium]